MIKGGDNDVSPARRDEGQIILTKRRFVNRGASFVRRGMRPLN